MENNELLDIVELKEVREVLEANEYIKKGWKLIATHKGGEMQLSTAFVMGRPSSVLPEEPPDWSAISQNSGN